MLAFTIHLLRPLTCSDLELNSETMNPFRYFGRIPRARDRPSLLAVAKSEFRK